METFLCKISAEVVNTCELFKTQAEGSVSISVYKLRVTCFDFFLSDVVFGHDINEYVDVAEPIFCAAECLLGVVSCNRA